LQEVGEIWSLVGAVQESGKFQNWCTARRRRRQCRGGVFRDRAGVEGQWKLGV